MNEPPKQSDETIRVTVLKPGRADACLAEALETLSRSRLKKLMEDGLVVQNGKPVRPSQKLLAGQVVEVTVPPPEPDRALPEEIPLEIIYEDQWLAAVAKPSGLVVHPAPGHSGGTLVNALLHHLKGLSGIGGVSRPGIVHRLDKDTSGILLVAKDDATHQGLQKLFRDRKLEKIYMAVALGRLSGKGEITTPIGRHPTDRKKFASPAPGGRAAATRWEAVKELRGATLLKVWIETGRTHQIRVHLASIGHPVAGDQLYGGNRAAGLMDSEARRTLMKLDSQALHAKSLRFSHPVTGEELFLTAPEPESFLQLVSSLENTPR